MSQPRELFKKRRVLAIKQIRILYGPLVSLTFDVMKTIMNRYLL